MRGRPRLARTGLWQVGLPSTQNSILPTRASMTSLLEIRVQEWTQGIIDKPLGQINQWLSLDLSQDRRLFFIPAWWPRHCIIANLFFANNLQEPSETNKQLEISSLRKHPAIFQKFLGCISFFHSSRQEHCKSCLPFRKDFRPLKQENSIRVKRNYNQHVMNDWPVDSKTRT